MNIPVQITVPQESVEYRFDQLCLQIIDAFRHLDFALEDWIHDAGKNCANGSTGCRVSLIQQINFDGSVATKAQAKRLHNLKVELAEAIDLRNAIIHSEPSFGLVNDVETIFLRPVGYRHGSNALQIHVTSEDINRAISTARSTANSLNAWRRQRNEKVANTKASSPPPPSRAAEGGP